MKSIHPFSIVLLAGVIMGCAPVASSVPKTKTQVVEDRLSVDNLRSSKRKIEVKVKSVAAASYDEYEHNLPSSYKALERLTATDQGFRELIDGRAINEVVLPYADRQSEVLVLMKITGGENHAKKADGLKGELFQSLERPDTFRLDLSKGKTSASQWQQVKNRIVEVMIFYRDPVSN